MTDAVHAEYGEPGTAIVSLLACSLDGTSITAEFTLGTRLAAIHPTPSAVERTTCNYGLALGMENVAATSGLRISATDATGEVRAVERTDHPFFLATLYQPQLTTAPGNPHPVIAAFVNAVLTADH